MTKTKVLNLIYGHLIQVSSVLGTGANYIIYLKTLTLDACSGRSTACSLLTCRGMEPETVVKQAPRNV